ncbi:MAG: hypothetical protein R3E65_05765 [Steroidobacteraceae bacterium]
MTCAPIFANGGRGLGNERRGARCPRIDLEHVDEAVLDRELDVHQADDLVGQCQLAGSLAQLVLHLAG